VKLLDLYSGAMGAGVGYYRAGFDVTGIDIHKRRDMPTEPVTFIKADAREVLKDMDFLRSFDLIHASPPCQTHTRAKHLRDAQGKSTSKLDLVDETRDALVESGVPYIMENVPGAPLREDVLLCGSMFPALHVYDDTGRRWLQRHRIFESTLPLSAPGPCRHKEAGVRPLGVYAGKADNIPSGGQTCRTLEEGRKLMGIDWMSWAALVEAIPPAYTYWLGVQAREILMAQEEGVA
jgi:DNA (cytosine-5)-methyltransferase 1